MESNQMLFLLCMCSESESFLKVMYAVNRIVGCYVSARDCFFDRSANWMKRAIFFLSLFQTGFLVALYEHRNTSYFIASRMWFKKEFYFFIFLPLLLLVSFVWKLLLWIHCKVFNKSPTATVSKRMSNIYYNSAWNKSNFRHFVLS